MRKPNKEQEAHGGIQRIYEFKNGFGASVIRHFFSYGEEDGLWELGVISPSGGLTYDTPITDDVVGRQTEAEIDALLDRIEALDREVTA